MTHSDSINDLATALTKAQAEIEGAIKGKVNPAFRSKYADLGSVWDACREPLTKHGLCVIQPVGKMADGTLCTITRLLHSSGQWIQDEGIPLLLSKQDMQGLGSALTYSRRYGLMSMVGIAPEDDDGNAASKPTNGHAATPEPAKTEVAPKGFTEWYAKLQKAAANGRDALRKEWADPKAEPFRGYVTKEQSDALKATAAQSEQVPA